MDETPIEATAALTDPPPAESLPAATPPTPPARRRPQWAWPGLAAVAIAGLIASNVFLAIQVNDTNDEVAALRESVEDVDARVDDAVAAASDAAGAARSTASDVAGLEARVGDVETQAADALVAAQAADNESTAPTLGAATVGLPVFTGDPTNDPAVGTIVSEIGGFEYYLEQEIGFDLTDGRSRAIVVWAHWCPFCQDELPALSEWIDQNASGLPNVEIFSVTTAMDDTAQNPLVPYLDSSQFPFPVLVDESGELSRLLGVNAFPFWIFFGPDGAVLGRLTGLRGMDELGSIFTQLDQIATG